MRIRKRERGLRGYTEADERRIWRRITVADSRVSCACYLAKELDKAEKLSGRLPPKAEARYFHLQGVCERGSLLFRRLTREPYVARRESGAAQLERLTVGIPTAEEGCGSSRW